MSYQYNRSDDVPLPHSKIHPPHPPFLGQTDATAHTSNHPLIRESPIYKYNAPSLHSPMAVSAPSPRRKQHPTKPRRTESRTKQKRDPGVEDRTNPMTNELTMVLRWCRSNDWTRVLQHLQANPRVALETLTMGNYISTTILHQAISSKGDITIRAKVISTILSATPDAAKMTNGYGSMPLHAIAQRNLKMDSQTKERLMVELVQCNKDALTSNGGIGGRTPLHIIFTDYVSPKLTKFIIENGPEACFMKDNKSCLPAHIACMRHCSPEKLRMLLAVNPAALHARTDENKTLLDLAKSKATQAHPNYALIDELQKQLAGDTSHYDPIIFNTPMPLPSTNRSRLHSSNEMNENVVGTPAIVSIASQPSNNPTHSTTYPSFTNTPSSEDQDYYYHFPFSQQPYQRHYLPHPTGPYHPHQSQYEGYPHHSTVGRVSSEDDEADAWNRSRLDSNGSWTSPIRQYQSTPHYYPHPYPYRHEGKRHDSAAMSDQRSFDTEPVPYYRAATHRDAPSFAHFHVHHESNSAERPQKALKMYHTPTPSWHQKTKSCTLQASNKSEEPAAKLLLDFSRNLNSNGDDSKTTNGSDQRDSDVDSAQVEGYNRYVRAYPAHYNIDNVTSPHSTKRALDIATASGITEV